jgi:hypothetical protein
MQWNRYLQNFRFIDALKIEMQDLSLERVPLHIAQDHLLGPAICDLQLENTRIERLLLRLVDNLAMFNGQGEWITVTTVKHRWHPSVPTQAAARTFPHIFSDCRGNRL